jgi:glycosyltransferase involved in cell wall biosynthesis
MAKSPATRNVPERAFEPLVSIMVMTYNSEKYILETLESARSQTYKNLELIVSDDCSGDNTTFIVDSWIEKHHGRFVKTEVIKTPVNTGIPANCNRGVKASAGEWIKIIAGDDILLDTCVASYIAEITNNPKLRFIASDMFYINAHGEIVESGDARYEAIRGYFFSLKAEEQLKLYARFPLFLNSPSFFINRNTLQSIDYFDEEFRIYDDLPMIFKILEKGIRIDYIGRKTVKYRIYTDSLSRTKNNSIGSIRNSEQIGCFKKYRKRYLKKSNITDLIVMYDFWLDHSYKGVFGFKGLPLMYLVNFYQNYLNRLARRYKSSDFLPSSSDNRLMN